MLTVIRFSPLNTPRFNGMVYRWSQGLGFGSFVSSTLGLVVTDRSPESHNVEQLLHCLRCYDSKYTLTECPAASFGVIP